MKKTFLFKNLFGLLLFLAIIQGVLLLEDAHKIPYIKDKLPYRYIVKAKQPIKLYDCDNFTQENNKLTFQKTGTLQTDDIAEYKGVVCGLWTRYLIQISDGRKACYATNDEENVEFITYNFYYF